MHKVFSVMLISMFLLAVYSFTFKVSIKAEESPELSLKHPVVSVYPEVVTTNIGDTFTISLVVYNLTDAYVQDPENPLARVSLGDLYGFDIKFSWDPTVIQYINYTNPSPQAGGYKHPNVTVPVENYSTPIAPSPFAGVLHGFGSQNQSLFEIKNVVNETVNLYPFYPSVRGWFAYATIHPAMPFNGNGTLFVMAFKALKKGISPIEIMNCELADKHGNWIGRTVSGQWLNPPHNGSVRTIEAPVTIPSDVNCDGKVDITDVVLAASQYGLHPVDPSYNSTIVAYADVASPYNRVIDILDIVTIASNYGKKYN